MITPKFWRTKNPIAYTLYPLGWVYGALTTLRIKLGRPKKVSKPVICIGNITAGGTGKTPVAISIASILQNKGQKPFFISRGYGGKLSNVLVDPLTHNSSDVGDEPLLLSRQAPAVINSNRYQAAQIAIKEGAEIIIMDDGFQNPTLYKDVSFVVVDAGFGFGNRYCIPAGPLRERVSRGMKRADGIILVGKDENNLAKKLSKRHPVFRATIQPVKPDITNTKVIAFAGIGRPSKFYDSLQEIGFKIVKTIDFPDHHKYTEEELDKIIKEADELGAEIYTTSKDFVKIPVSKQTHFKVLEIEIKWQDEQKLIDFIEEKINAKRK
ncbi:MAG: tetraacyldisaccharide 4'-kinase [Lactobacillus sp.]|jgi:tetraacyldisaccharide 4'-kinase|nr:tetraacyldisaccharide 4'-kinase [Lactobacillus sp.]